MSSYTVALNFEDGVTRFVECKAGEKVLVHAAVDHEEHLAS